MKSLEQQAEDEEVFHKLDFSDVLRVKVCLQNNNSFLPVAYEMPSRLLGKLSEY
jgi:hypothetical protein